MDKLFEQIAKVLPPPFLVGLLVLGVAFFTTYYARGYRAYGDVLQDNILRNTAVVIIATAVLFWLNTDRTPLPSANPVLVVPFFANDEHDQYRTALTYQIEERLNAALRRNGAVLRLPSFLNDDSTAKQIAYRYKASAVLYDAAVLDTKDSRVGCFRLLQVEPELYKTYSLVPMSIPGVQLDEIITTLRGVQVAPNVNAAMTNELLGKVDSLQNQVAALETELRNLRSKSATKTHDSGHPSISPVERHALIIAADGGLQSRLPVLIGARSDAQHVDATLSQLGYKTRLLVGPTRLEIIKAISTAKSGLTNRDLLIVYYTGHTTVTGVGGKQILQLLASDFRPDTPETAISINDFVESIANANEAQVLLILDGCFGSSGLDNNLLQKIREQESFNIVTGSNNREAAIDASDLGGSVFANTFVRAIRELSSGGLAPIYLSDVFRRVSSMMQIENRRMGIEQNPQLLAASGDLVIAGPPPVPTKEHGVELR